MYRNERLQKCAGAEQVDQRLLFGEARVEPQAQDHVSLVEKATRNDSGCSMKLITLLRMSGSVAAAMGPMASALCCCLLDFGVAVGEVQIPHCRGPNLFLP